MGDPRRTTSRQREPEYCLNEVSNALVKATRRKEIGREDARLKFQALQKLLQGNLSLVGQDELVPLAFEMALSNPRRMVYDYLFIALAKRRLLALCTRDRAQHQVALRNVVPSTLV